jgi:hypothetical protein
VSNTALEIPRAVMRRVDGEKFILGTELVELKWISLRTGEVGRIK